MPTDKGSILKGTARGIGRLDLTGKARLCYWWCSRPTQSNFRALKPHTTKELSLGIRKGTLHTHARSPYPLHILSSFFWGCVTPRTHPVLQSTRTSPPREPWAQTHFSHLDPAAVLIVKGNVAQHLWAALLGNKGWVRAQSGFYDLTRC